MQRSVIFCGVNWLGDSIMTMPAIQTFKSNYPDAKISILVKPKLKSLWECHPAIDEIIELRSGFRGMFDAVKELKKGKYELAYIFPNSFRSALIPFLAGVAERIAVPGHQRAWLLTRYVVHDYPRKHQGWEYMNIIGAGVEGELEAPELSIPDEIEEAVKEKLDLKDGDNCYGLIPGAAYGPAKRWPKEHYIEVGNILSKDAKLLVFGTADEAELCNEIADGIGESAISMAGKTSLPELVCLLGKCRAVVSNDSGGMHLAAAAGTKVVAVFGLTDHSKTGPVGPGHTVLRKEGIEGSRDIARDSVEATEALKSVTPAQVVGAIKDILD